MHVLQTLFFFFVPEQKYQRNHWIEHISKQQASHKQSFMNVNEIILYYDCPLNI